MITIAECDVRGGEALEHQDHAQLPSVLPDQGSDTVHWTPCTEHAGNICQNLHQIELRCEEIHN